MDNYTPIEGVVLATTDKSVLVGLKDQLPLMQVWIPRSLCESGDELNEDDEDIRVADWWLEDNGLL